MNPRSRKALNKVDLFSRLHDAMLIQILSLLPEPDAHRTRVLSSRWMNLWALLPILHIVMPFCWTVEELNRFHDSVDQTLNLRGGMPIQRFYLYCSANCNYNRVCGWLRQVVQCKVQELVLRFPADRLTVRFCWDLFKTCTTLVSLTLSGGFVLNVPEAEMLFPCLMTLNLVSIVYSGNKCFKNLICGCPVLEELFVERHLIGQLDNMDTFEVISPSLKRLRISFSLFGAENNEVVISAPALEYLNILDVMSTNYTLTNTLSLAEAHIKIRAREDEHVAQLVTGLSSVKILTLVEAPFMALTQHHGLNTPTFPNLVKFGIEILSTTAWRKLPILLNKMPNLEHITFLEGIRPLPHDFNMMWNPPMEVPACLCFKVKEIIIENRETISPAQYKFIRYLLMYANNLEMLKINAHKIDPNKRYQISKFYRGSKSCQIVFI